MKYWSSKKKKNKTPNRPKNQTDQLLCQIAIKLSPVSSHTRKSKRILQAQASKVENYLNTHKA